jgi:hypothetical protein
MAAAPLLSPSTPTQQQQQQPTPTPRSNTNTSSSSAAAAAPTLLPAIHSSLPRPSMKRSESVSSTPSAKNASSHQLKRTITTSSKKGGTLKRGGKKRKRKNTIPLPQRIKQFADSHIPNTYPSTHIVLRTIRRLALAAHAYNFFFITLAIPWTCCLVEPASLGLAYSCDFLILIDILAQSLVQIEQDFGVIETDFRKLSYRFMINQCGLLRFLCALPWDCIPLIIAYNSSLICHDHSYLSNGQYRPR